VDDIQKRQAQRLLVMQAIFKASGGSETTSVSGQELLSTFNLSEQELGDACKYLEGEYLIKGSRTMWSNLVPFTVNLTHRGIKEMEESLQAPAEPTEHFPAAISIVHVEGNLIGSPIQSGSPGARQEVTVDIKLGDVRDFISRLETALPELGLPDEESQELTAEVATIRAQIESPKPKKNIIRESLGSVRAILVGAGGNMVATGLLDALQHIHF
jgi:hypothetical protein